VLWDVGFAAALWHLPAGWQVRCISRSFQTRRLSKSGPETLATPSLHRLLPFFNWLHKLFSSPRRCCLSLARRSFPAAQQASRVAVALTASTFALAGNCAFGTLGLWHG
jgi:hypothetical protein